VQARLQRAHPAASVLALWLPCVIQLHRPSKPAGAERAARERARPVAPAARTASAYTAAYPPPPPGTLQDPALRPRPAAAPLAPRRFTARSTYQAEMLPAARAAPRQLRSEGGCGGCPLLCAHARGCARGACWPWCAVL